MKITLIALINNAALLLVLSVIYQQTSQINDKNTKLKQIVNGILISLTCIAIMSIPFKLNEGVVFDTRSILISLTALLFGAIPTTITVVVASIFRIVQGGAGALPGVSVIISSALIGSIWRSWIYSKVKKLRWLNVYLMSIVVHVVMIACMNLLPYPDRINVIKEITFPVLLIYPVVSVLLYLLLTQQQAFLQVQGDLKQSEKRFRLLFNNTPLGYQSLDINGKIIEVNQQWLETFGYSKDEVIGKWFGDFLHPTYKIIFQEKLSQLEKTGQIHGEFVIQHKSGIYLYISLDGNAVSERNEENKQILCILKDITESKREETKLQISEKKYRQLYETMALGVVYQTADGRILSANPAAEKILGLTLEQMMDKTSLDPEWKSIREDGSELSGENHPSMIALRTGKPVGPVVMGVYQPILTNVSGFP